MTFIAEINFVAILTNPLPPHSLLSHRDKKVMRNAFSDTMVSHSGWEFWQPNVGFVNMSQKTAKLQTVTYKMRNLIKKRAFIFLLGFTFNIKHLEKNFMI